MLWLYKLTQADRAPLLISKFSIERVVTVENSNQVLPTLILSRKATYIYVFQSTALTYKLAQTVLILQKVYNLDKVIFHYI